MLKKIANKILKNEIDDLEKKIKDLNEKYYELANEYANGQAEIAKKSEEIKSKNETIEQLTDENDILKKYYHLDSEPTDEEKIKIRIDLKIHDLEMQLIQERIRALEFYPQRFFITNPYSFMNQPVTYIR